MINIIDYKNGSNNKSPIITNLKIIGEATQSSIKISYHVEDAENQIVRHHLTIPNLYNKKEITPEVGYDKNDFEYNITGLEMGKTYSIMITCFDGLNEGKSNALQRKTKSSTVHEIEIDELNMSPSSAITYKGDSSKMTPAEKSNLNGWENEYPYNKIRPCGFKQGKVYKYISKNDFSRYEDGTLVGEDVDVMIEFPKLYWSIKKTGDLINIRFSKDKIDETFICPAHTIGTREVDNVYIGAYNGCEISGKLRSIRNKTLCFEKNISQFRQLAQANGKGYQQMCYYPLLMLQILYIIAYKTRNVTWNFGAGIGYKNESFRCGATYNKGMYYGTTDTNNKIFGLEDLWGYQILFLDGIYTLGTTLKISKQDVFNNNGSGYEDCGVISEVSGIPSKVLGTSKGGFIAIETKGSSSSYYMTHPIDILQNRLGSMGNSTFPDRAALFSISIDMSASDNFLDLGGRLCYIG